MLLKCVDLVIFRAVNFLAHNQQAARRLRGLRFGGAKRDQRVAETVDGLMELTATDALTLEHIPDCLT